MVNLLPLPFPVRLKPLSPSLSTTYLPATDSTHSVPRYPENTGHAPSRPLNPTTKGSKLPWLLHARSRPTVTTLGTLPKAGPAPRHPVFLSGEQKNRRFEPNFGGRPPWRGLCSLPRRDSSRRLRVAGSPSTYPLRPLWNTPFGNNGIARGYWNL